MNLKQNRLLVALVALVAVILITLVVSPNNDAVDTDDSPAFDAPSIDQAAVDSITLQRAGEPAVELSKGEGGWQMTAPIPGSADETAVTAMLEKLSELQVTGSVTSNESLHDRLEVVADSGTRVTVKAGATTAADIWLGAQKSGGTMLRKEGEAHVVTVRGSIRYPFDKAPHLYRDRTIVDEDPDKAKTLQLTSEKGTFRFDRDAEGNWKQAEGEAAIEEFDPGKVNSTVNSLCRLRASQFAPVGSNDEANGLASPKAQVELQMEGQAEPIRIALGGLDGESNQYSLRRDGMKDVFRVAKYSGDALMPDSEAFEKSAAPPPGAAPPGMPGMPGMGGAGGQQLPPELMQQLQRQIAAQQGK